jgi:hypothetical protein
MGGRGFIMGIDLALEIPLGSRDVDYHDDIQFADDEVGEARDKIKRRAKAVVKALPILFQVNLLRIGYLF